SPSASNGSPAQGSASIGPSVHPISRSEANSGMRSTAASLGRWAAAYPSGRAVATDGRSSEGDDVPELGEHELVQRTRHRLGEYEQVTGHGVRLEHLAGPIEGPRVVQLPRTEAVLHPQRDDVRVVVREPRGTEGPLHG